MKGSAIGLFLRWSLVGVLPLIGHQPTAAPHSVPQVNGLRERMVRSAVALGRPWLSFFRSAALRTLTFVPVMLVLLGSCVQPDKQSIERQPYQREKDKYVSVSLHGDVKAWGQRRIRRELSKESILEAGEGFAGLSMIEPKTITLTRGAQSYKIRFEAMTKGKWKGFLLQDGDKIVVHRILF